MAQLEKDPMTGAYIVKSGDSLSKIASTQGRTLQELLASNPQYASNPNLIRPGQTVNFGASTQTPAPRSYAELTSPTPAPQGPTRPYLPGVSPEPTQASNPTTSFTKALIDILKNAQGTNQTGQAQLMKQSQDIKGQALGDSARIFNNKNLAPNSGTSLGLSAQNEFDPSTLSIENQQKLATQNLGNITDIIDRTQKSYDTELERIAQAQRDLADAQYKSQTLAETIRAHKADEYNARQKNIPTNLNTQYAIKAGDTLKSLADQSGMTVDEFRSANPGINENNLQVGQMINIPSSGTGNYSTIDISRYGRAANSIVKNFIGLPQYNLTANGLPYLQRIQAADSIPGSVSDAELLDSIVKLNTGGNQVTEAQVKLITGGRSLSDTVNVWYNKINNGGVLSNEQRTQLTQLANKVFDRYKADYQPIYTQATKQLQDAGIPKAFWTIPDLNTLSSKSSNNANVNGSNNDPLGIR